MSHKGGGKKAGPYTTSGRDVREVEREQGHAASERGHATSERRSSPSPVLPRENRDERQAAADEYPSGLPRSHAPPWHGGARAQEDSNEPPARRARHEVDESPELVPPEGSPVIRRIRYHRHEGDPNTSDSDFNVDSPL